VVSDRLLEGLSPASLLLLHVAVHQEMVPVQLLTRSALTDDPEEAVQDLLERGLVARTDIDGLLELGPLGYALKDTVVRRWPELHETLRPPLLARLFEDFGLDPGHPLRRALEAVDRADFVPTEVRFLADLDLPVPLGVDDITTSAPHAVLSILQAVLPRIGESVLLCGAKGGVTLALAAHLVGPTGRAVAQDTAPPLVDHISTALQRYPDLSAEARYVSDVTLGLRAEGPWDVIVVNGSVPKLPWPLLHQLDDDGGRVLFFLQEPGNDGQACYVLRREGSDVTVELGGRFAFTPVYGRYGWDRIEDLAEALAPAE